MPSHTVETHIPVSGMTVEATGAWDSDCMLADRLAAAGCRVLSVWVTAPLEVTLQRLAGRPSRKVPRPCQSLTCKHLP